MKSEKRSLSINEVRELSKSKGVKKVCAGRIWVVSTEKKGVENGPKT